MSRLSFLIPHSSSLRHAVLAGIMLGIALWTKPTAGAFVWGLGLVTMAGIGFYGLSSRFGVHSSRVTVSDNSEPRTQNSELEPQSLQLIGIALLTLLAAAPLGGVWYIRNLLLGHEAVRFPPSFWLTQAQSSGVEFGWLLLALLLGTAYLLWRGSVAVRRTRLLMGAVLVLAATLPTIFVRARMGVIELTLLIIGAVVWASGVKVLGSKFSVLASRFSVGDGLQQASHSSEPRTENPEQSYILVAALLLAAPYFITWFFSYSYHYRLSFAIVPLLMLPSAVLIAELTGIRYRVSGDKKLQAENRELISHPSSLSPYILVIALLVALSIPGIVLPLYDGATGWDGLWSGELTDDISRQRSGNAALLNVVDGLQIYLDEHPDTPMRVFAPGVETLPFFFPLEDIRITPPPMRLEELDGATYFINSHPQGTGVYERVPLLENQVLGALGRQDIMRRAWGMDDGTFRFDVYELFTEQRFVPPQPSDAATADIRFGDFVRVLGNDLGTFDFYTNRPVYLTLYWQAIAPATEDYSLYVHLRDAEGNLIHNWDAPIALNTALNPPRYYSTRMFEPDEYIVDVRVLRLPEDKPLGQGLSLVVGFYNPLTNTRVPMTVDGVVSDDGYLVDDRMTIIEVPTG